MKLEKFVGQLTSQWVGLTDPDDFKCSRLEGKIGIAQDLMKKKKREDFNSKTTILLRVKMTRRLQIETHSFFFRIFNAKFVIWW